MRRLPTRYGAAAGAARLRVRAPPRVRLLLLKPTADIFLNLPVQRDYADDTLYALCVRAARCWLASS
jgi:hypothetical protein